MGELLSLVSFGQSLAPLMAEMLFSMDLLLLWILATRL